MAWQACRCACATHLGLRGPFGPPVKQVDSRVVNVAACQIDCRMEQQYLKSARFAVFVSCLICWGGRCGERRPHSGGQRWSGQGTRQVVAAVS